MWIPPEIRDPICRHAPTGKSISYFGAVRVRDGRLVASKPEGHFDAQTCWSFLRKLRRSSRRRGRRVVVIVDNAIWISFVEVKPGGEERMTRAWQ